MTLPRSVADVLAHHVRFEIESIDPMYLHLYQPRLQFGGGAPTRPPSTTSPCAANLSTPQSPSPSPSPSPRHVPSATLDPSDHLACAAHDPYRDMLGYPSS
jgi:hypothetical protein